MSTVRELFMPVGEENGGSPAVFVEPSPRASVGRALRRELLIAWHRTRSSGASIKRIRADTRRASLTAGLRSSLRAGVAILPRSAKGNTPLLEIIDRVGLSNVDRVGIGSGGTVLVSGRLDPVPVIVRVGAAGSPADPENGRGALATLVSHPLVPDLIDFGRSGEWNWTVESRLAGARPVTLEPGVLEQVIGFLSGLPEQVASPRLQTEAEIIARAIPAVADQVKSLGESVSRDLEGMPSVLGHGDFWHGNLLVHRGALTGVVDWDAWSTNGVVGVDALHCLGTAQRLREKRSFGEMWATRPWRAEPARRVLHRLNGSSDGIRGGFETLGLAWWLSQVAGDLRRDPTLAGADRWIADNVLRPLEAMGKWS